MPNSNKPEIDELLSGYIDGELSERQRTELKRMLKHDSQIGERLAQLRKQRQLLSSLPTASAPQGLLDDVTATLERRYILDQCAPSRDETAGARQLMFRHLSTAAVLLLVAGVLVWFVLDIITPVDSNEASIALQPEKVIETTALQQNPQIANTIRSIAPDANPFSSALTLTTDQVVAVNNFIEKTIFSNSLRDNTVPKRTDNATIYQIRTSRPSVLALLKDLQPVWARSSGADFSVTDPANDTEITIANVTAKQAIAILDQSEVHSRIAMAANYAAFNEESVDMPKTAVAKSDIPVGLDIPIKPILTAAEDMPNLKPTTNTKEPEELVDLTITVMAQ
jgi:hypothetical protein